MRALNDRGHIQFLPKADPLAAQKRYRHFNRVGRLAIGSDYVVHLAEDGSQQVLFMKFQDMPEDLQSGLELEFVASDPMLFGMSEEFEHAPKQYRDAQGNSASKPRGSRFVVQGFVYDAKKVETNHLGGVQISLVHAKSCNVRELQFFDHVRPYICLPEHD